MKSKLNLQETFIFQLSLISWVLDNPGAEVKQAALHFEASEALITELFKQISFSGVADKNGILLHDDMFDINWDELDNGRLELINYPALEHTPKLSNKEAAAIISGLRYLASIPDTDATAIESLLDKLSADHVDVMPAVKIYDSQPPAVIEQIKEAIKAKKVLRFDYLAQDGTRENRAVEPFLVQALDSNWYLKGWCLLRDAPRTFRIDQMSILETTAESVTHENTSVESDIFAVSGTETTVTAVVSKAVQPLVEEWFGAADDSLTKSAQVANFHAMKRFVAGFAGDIEVIEPVQLRKQISNWAMSALAQYQDSSE